MKNQNRLIIFKRIIFSVFIAVVGVTSINCTSLKKKFVRQKKGGDRQDKFIPVLEPVDYSVEEQSMQKKYAALYSLWKIWQRDLLEDIDRDRNEKNQKYLLGEITSSLEKMQGLLVEGKHAELQLTIEGYLEIKAEYAKPSNFRQKTSIKRQVDGLGKTLRLEYSPRLLREEDYQK